MSEFININIESKHIENAINKQKGIKAKRVCMTDWESEAKDSILKQENHTNMLEYLNNGIEFEGDQKIIKELKKKLESYKQQDKKKKRYEKKNFIKLDELLKKLEKSELKCYYCLKTIKLVFDNVRDPEQWTLDRINNDIQHTNENTVVTDLKCNLQRRVKDEKKFLCDKQLTITMLGK